MSSYHHLTQDQRCQIYTLKSIGRTQKFIARYIGVHPSTVSRELKRNQGQRGYRYQQAHRLAGERRYQASCQARIMKRPLMTRITQHLKARWSPEQISGRLKREGINISHESIYQFVWRDKRKGGQIYRLLRHQGKKYNKQRAKNAGRGLIPHRIDIDQRPRVVEKKTRYGDWEGDTVIGARHKGALATYVDRSTVTISSSFILYSLLAR